MTTEELAPLSDNAKAIAKALSGAPKTSERIAELTGLELAVVRRELRTLRARGIVTSHSLSDGHRAFSLGRKRRPSFEDLVERKSVADEGSGTDSASVEAG